MATKVAHHPTPEEAERFADAWATFVGALRRARARATNDPEAQLTLSQYHLLSALDASPTLCVGEIAKQAAVSSPTATRMLDGLEKDGIVQRERHPEDRRSVAIRLTPKGRKTLKAEQQRHSAKRDALMNQLTPEERAQAERLLPRLAELMEQL